MTDKINVKIVEAIEKFQCGGCTNGSDTNCSVFKEQHYGNGCGSHSAGTFILGSGKIALGLPKGFNKVGKLPNNVSTNIRIFESKDIKDFFNVFNLPTWTMEYEGYLLVRTYLPRMDASFVDIFIDGKEEDINVEFSGEHISDFDSKNSVYKSVDVSLFQELID
jgi:hypothetical protein